MTAARDDPELPKGWVWMPKRMRVTSRSYATNENMTAWISNTELWVERGREGAQCDVLVPIPVVVELLRLNGYTIKEPKG